MSDTFKFGRPTVNVRHKTLWRYIQKFQLAFKEKIHHAAVVGITYIEFTVAAGMPLDTSDATWSCIRAISGDTTMAQPSDISAGIW